METGAIIGVIVGVSFFGLIIGFIVYFSMKYNQRTKQLKRDLEAGIIRQMCTYYREEERVKAKILSYSHDESTAYIQDEFGNCLTIHINHIYAS